jgi:hypothetical protein
MGGQFRFARFAYRAALLGDRERVAASYQVDAQALDDQYSKVQYRFYV